MHPRLQKLAGLSKSLRKEAGALTGALGFAAKHPVMTGATAVGTAAGVGKARESKVGFHPNTHNLMNKVGSATMNTDTIFEAAFDAEPRLMEKTAGAVKAIERLAPEFRAEVLNDFVEITNTTKEKFAGSMANAAVGTLIGAIGAAVASDLYDAAKRGLSKATNYRRIMESNPDLRSADKSKLRSAYDMLHRFGPEFTADPSMGGSLLKQIVELPDIQHKTIMDIISARKNLAEARSKIFNAPLAGVGKDFGKSES